MTNAEYAHSLRLIADFFEAHEELPLPPYAEEFKYYSPSGRAEMAAVAKALGSCDKVIEGEWFDLVKMFGGIKFIARDYRNRICEAVVIGKKFVPEVVTPAREAEIIPAHEEDIIEWHCEDSLLAQASD